MPKSWLIKCTAAHTVSAPIAGTSSLSSVTALPLCRARRFIWRRFTHSWASIPVIADIGQPTQWGSQWVAHRLECFGPGRRVGRTGGGYPAIPLPHPNVAEPRIAELAPPAIAASCAVAHCFTTDLSLSVLMWLPSRPRTVACQSPDGS
jgi:hypothetical protein